MNINFKNNSLIYGPKDIGKFLDKLCPKFFKTVPCGAHKGEFKYWPIFWLLVPSFVIFVPISFLIAMIFDHKNFFADVKKIFKK